ncbi:MAG: hypothetical protein V1734_02850 [Nanoarchaeota archaeon]
MKRLTKDERGKCRLEGAVVDMEKIGETRVCVHLLSLYEAHGHYDLLKDVKFIPKGTKAYYAEREPAQMKDPFEVSPGDTIDFNIEFFK